MASQAGKDAVAVSAVDIHDHVAEAYFGKMGDAFMRETQNRIHWICRSVVGSSVLDVGCSQGIVSLLLGRERCRVIGIDVAQRSIDEAKELLLNEAEAVQNHVEFIQGDFLAQDFGDLKFESVVISEVLEHLLRPESFVEKAADLLGEGGRLVVTVPFGINDFVDHKKTFYLLDPYRLMEAHFDIQEVVMLGKWVGLVGVRKPAPDVGSVAPHIEKSLVGLLETSFLSLERELRTVNADTREKLLHANARFRDANNELVALKARLAKAEHAASEADSMRKAAELELAAVRKLHDVIDRRLAEMTQLLQSHCGCQGGHAGPAGGGKASPKEQ